MIKYKKYSYYCEGKCEEKLLYSIKVTLLNSKFFLCKRCSKIANGTPRIKDIPKISNCCKRIIIFDEDNLSNVEIERFKKELLGKNSILVISRPSIECVLYSIFDVPDAEFDKKTLEEKLELSLKKFSMEYNHKPNNINKIIEWVNNDLMIKERWIKNLNKLNEKNRSNFIEIINFFESCD